MKQTLLILVHPSKLHLFSSGKAVLVWWIIPLITGVPGSIPWKNSKKDFIYHSLGSFEMCQRIFCRILHIYIKLTLGIYNVSVDDYKKIYKYMSTYGKRIRKWSGYKDAVYSEIQINRERVFKKEKEFLVKWNKISFS